MLLEVAWITGSMLLKTTGVVAEVTNLSLALLWDQLCVTFAGERQKQYANQPATVLTVNGNCHLPKTSRCAPIGVRTESQQVERETGLEPATSSLGI